MAKIKVEVVGAYIDGNAPGSTVEIDENSAKHFESIGYARIIKQAPKKVADEKGKSAPKKSAAKSKPKADISKDK